MNPEFVTENLNKYKKEIEALPELYQKRKRQIENKIDAVCEEAGILTLIENLRQEIETVKSALQQKADVLSGRIKMLEEIHKEFFYAPIPEGVTHMYGIELKPLDPETRLLVLGGNPDTIQMLGGKLEPEEPEPEIEETPQYTWSTEAHWKTRVKQAIMISQQDPKYFEFIYEQETNNVRNHLDTLLERLEEEISEEEESSEGYFSEDDGTY